MAGPSLQHQESHVYMRDFAGCRWALLQWFDFQRKLRFLPGNKSKGLEQFPFLSKDSDSTDMDSDSSTTSKHSSRKKYSGKSKSLLKSFISKKFYRKQDQKQKILPLSPQLLRTISIHHLEPKNYMPSDTSSSRSSSSRGSFRGYIYTATSSSSRNENYSLLSSHLNVIQEEAVSRSSSVLSEIHPDLKSTSMSNLDATGNTNSNQHRPHVNKNFKQMITMDSVLHKIPYGRKLPEYSKFSSNTDLFRSVSVNYEREVPDQVMKRSRSLSDSVGRYSQLLEPHSRESTHKATRPGTRLATVQSIKENTMANSTSQEKDSESMSSETKLTADELFEKQDNALFSLGSTDSISSPSESMVDDIRLTEEESLRESKDASATCALSNGIESNSTAFKQDAEGIGSGNRTLESSEECEDLDLVKEKGELSAVQDEAGPLASYYDETFHESSASVLDFEFIDDLIPSKIQNLTDSNNISGPSLEDMSDDPNNLGETANDALANFDILPSQSVQWDGADLDSLKDLFENFGFGDGDFLEIINVLLQEVCQENDKIPFGYDLTKFDYDFGRFDYDENMSPDQNNLYALTHEALRENLRKYLGTGTLVPSYSMVPKSNSLQNGLIKDLWKKLNCYIYPEICFSGNNFFEGILTSSSLQNDGWLNYPTEKEYLAVELGDEIFDSIIDDLICEL